jgi:hypothetical protein
MLRHVVRLAAVTLAVAAAGVVVPSAARAASCGGDSGVTVVVDFHGLDGKGAQAACDPGGGGEKGSDQFTEVGYTLSYVQTQPGFVCQVDDAPDSPCVRTPPATAYWSVWWSDGKSGTWKYASVAVGSLHVKDGGYIALSWQKGQAQAPPRVKATAHKPSVPSSPTTAPPSSPTSPAPPSTHPTQAVTTAPATTSAPPTPSRPPSSHHKKKHHHARALRATPQEHATNSTTSRAEGPVAGVAGGGDSGSGGAPGWLAPVAIVVLFAAGATVALVRRKSRGGV